MTLKNENLISENSHTSNINGVKYTVAMCGMHKSFKECNDFKKQWDFYKSIIIIDFKYMDKIISLHLSLLLPNHLQTTDYCG